jgi:hypothetical protein
MYSTLTDISYDGTTIMYFISRTLFMRSGSDRDGMKMTFLVRKPSNLKLFPRINSEFVINEMTVAIRLLEVASRFFSTLLIFLNFVVLVNITN